MTASMASTGRPTVASPSTITREARSPAPATASLAPSRSKSGGNPYDFGGLGSGISLDTIAASTSVITNQGIIEGNADGAKDGNGIDVDGNISP